MTKFASFLVIGDDKQLAYKGRLSV